MEDSKKQSFGTVSYVNAPRGFLFIVQRHPGGERKSFFGHFSQILEGEPIKGARAFFDEDWSDPKGPSARRITIGEVVPRLAESPTDILDKVAKARGGQQ